MVQFLIKKIARFLCTIQKKSNAGCGIRVLTYHHFGYRKFNAYYVSKKCFKNQIIWLKDNNAIVSFEQMKKFAAGEEQLTTNSVLITIDDGYKDALDGLEILDQYKIPAILFVTTDFVDGAECINNNPAGMYLNWNDLKEIAHHGFLIGSHGSTHLSLGELTASKVFTEGMESKTKLQNALSFNIETFAYPFGTVADFSEMTSEILAHIGYRYIFTSQHGTVTTNTNKLQLPRIKIENGDTIGMFRQIINGGLDRWAFVDRHLQIFQRKRNC